MGDRFGRQGHAQLKAIIEAGKKGIEITPVWNKSNREHNIIGTQPSDVRFEADTVTRNAGFKKSYFVDADHINFDTVDRFIDCSDFFTVDVASYIGKLASRTDIERFISFASGYTGKLEIPGISKTLKCSKEHLNEIAEKYLFASKKAGEIYRKIEKVKGKGNFVTEVSMDEVVQPQTPLELFFILAMLAGEGVPLQTIAPKFSGRFNKGVDYSGDPLRFATEFEEDLLVIGHAVKEFGLPENLKISVHSGSDKFSIYGHIGSIIKKHDKGIHLKTAGTTWLEEVIGLAIAGDDGLDAAKKIYAASHDRKEELCAPYADVIDIDESKLPSIDEVNGWSGEKFANTLRHIPGHPDYNPNFRQLIHVAYKVAAEMGTEYTLLLEKYADVVGNCVEENLYDRHLKRLFDL